MESLTIVITALVGFAVASLVLAVTADRQRDRAAVLARISQYPRTSVSLVSDYNPASVLRERPKTGNPFLRLFIGSGNYAQAVSEELLTANLDWDLGEYLTIRAVIAFVFILPSLVVRMPILALPLAVVGFQLPRMYVHRRQNNRLSEFDDRLVDALTLMANALKSGSSFLQAISTVSQEFEGPIRDEFGRVVAEINVGTSVDSALENLVKRVHSYDLFLAVTAMLVQRQTGGNLSEILDQIANTIRERMRLLRQVRVLTAQERMSAMVIGALPICLLIVFTLINPQYPRPFFETYTGRLVLGAAFGFEIIGFVVLNRMAKLDV